MAIFWQHAGYVFVSIVPMCTFFQFFQLVFSFRIPIVFSKCLGKKFLPKHSFFYLILTVFFNLILTDLVFLMLFLFFIYVFVSK